VDFETEKTSHGNTSRPRLLGLVGFLSLILPWEFGFWEAPSGIGGNIGTLAAWHLVRLGWIDSDFIFAYVFQSVSALSLWLSFLAVAGFLLVLVGSILLIQRKRKGGLLLLGSMLAWVLYVFFEFMRVSPYLIIPVGAAFCGIAGVVSLLPKTNQQ
jgi:hypothetical protein